mmetsp:Transcript_25430/g.55612  ORF Transcript_25430/g.55612 Transcript_25430/m.55612 type:complete len:232 (-) Transcript_25430:460-1155(-)
MPPFADHFGFGGHALQNAGGRLREISQKFGNVLAAHLVSQDLRDGAIVVLTAQFIHEKGNALRRAVNEDAQAAETLRSSFRQSVLVHLAKLDANLQRCLVPILTAGIREVHLLQVIEGQQLRRLVGHVGGVAANAVEAGNFPLSTGLLQNQVLHQFDGVGISGLKCHVHTGQSVGIVAVQDISSIVTQIADQLPIPIPRSAPTLLKNSGLQDIVVVHPLSLDHTVDICIPL